MNNKIEIKNSFFELIFFIISLILSFFRSIYLFFTLKRIKQNIFFLFLDFIFKKWPKYFWEKPSFYKATSFVANIFNYLFKK